MITEKILPLYGVTVGELVPINDGFHNTVYSHGNLIFRLSPSSRRKKEDILNELEFIKDLWKKAVPVSMPVKSIRGNFVETVGNQYFLVVFEKAKGTPIDVTNLDIWNKELYYYWGNLMGKMHSAGKNIELNRPRWTVNQPDLLNLLPRINSEPIAEKYKQHLKYLVAFPLTSDLFGLIHNDFHQGNLFVDKGRLTLFDFDDSAYHWFAYDIATSFYHAYWQASSFTPENTQFSREFWEHFLRGYQKEHKISKELIQQIPIFLKIREIFLYTLFLEKWDLLNLQDWQEYTLIDLKNNIESEKPYSNVNFEEIIDKLV
jgi:amicoumacin kinase